MTGATLGALELPLRQDLDEPIWRRDAREAAFEWLSTHSLPTRRDEAWRYTAVDELLELSRSAVPARRPVTLDPRQVDLMAGDHGGPRLVFVNGIFASGTSRTQAEDGVTVVPFSDPASQPEMPLMGPDRLDGFAALSWAVGAGGASIRISAHVAVEAPVHIVHVAAPELDTPLITHPNSMVHVEAGARLTLIESFVGFAGTALTNASTFVDVGDRATLDYHRIQTETAHAAHVGQARIHVGEAAHLHATSVSIGAATSRAAFDVTANGDRSTVEIDGLYLPSGTDQHDHVVTVEHLGSHTISTQRFKGVIDDRARGSFTGHVIVRPGTVDTSATQTNHSLLLTRTAESDSRPWLEILSDDVSCTHGASVGRLDDDALFYLRSRGIAEADARRVLIDGFVSEIVESVGTASLRDHLSARITAKQRRTQADR